MGECRVKNYTLVAVVWNMVEVECPFCTETIDLGSDSTGAYECPYCNQDFEYESSNFWEEQLDKKSGREVGKSPGERDDNKQATLQIKERPSILGLVFMWGFTIIWCTASLFATVSIGSLVMSDLDTNDWTPVDGVVTSSSVSSKSGSEGGVVYCLNVDYEYTIDGTTYQGDKVSYTSDSSCDSWSKNADEDYPEGKEITVYVNPSNHREAVLDTGLSGVDFSNLCICLFPLVGIVLLYGSVSQTFSKSNKR